MAVHLPSIVSLTPGVHLVGLGMLLGTGTRHMLISTKITELALQITVEHQHATEFGWGWDGIWDMGWDGVGRGEFKMLLG